MDNLVRLQLFALAYNLGNFLRRLALPKRVRQWSLRTLRVKLIKIGAKIVKHARYVTFQIAEVLVSKRLFQKILEHIGQLKPMPRGVGELRYIMVYGKSQFIITCQINQQVSWFSQQISIPTKKRHQSVFLLYLTIAIVPVLATLLIP